MRDIDSAVSFSPDGKRLSFMRGIAESGDLQIHSANLDGGEDRVIGVFKEARLSRAFLNGPAWSPDGKTILAPMLLDKGFSLSAIDLTDGRPSEFMVNPEFIGRPAWMQDGNSFVVPMLRGPRDDTRDRNATQLWRVAFPGGETKRITNDLTDYGPVVDVTRDGRLLVGVERHQEAHVWEVPGGQANKASQITSGGVLYAAVSVAPSGKLLLRKFNGKMEMMNWDGSERKTFQPEALSFMSARFCGDRYIIFDNHNAGTVQLWRADSDGSHAVKLLDRASFPDCSPDGKWVLYGSEGRLYRIPIDGGTPKEVVPQKGGGVWGRISPDGNWIAYRYPEGEPTQERLGVGPALGGPPVHVFSLPGDADALEWAPDGKGVQFLLTRKGATNVWEQKLKGGEPEQVTNFAPGKIFDFAWTQDGKTLLLAKGEITRDVVMISFR